MRLRFHDSSRLVHAVAKYLRAKAGQLCQILGVEAKKKIPEDAYLEFQT
jgi:hypothetical protein